MKKTFQYPTIDLKKTGKKIKQECQINNISVKEIQECLGIGAYQSVYNWFSGKTLPSLDNMFALSRLLGISMENMIVCKDDNSKIADICYRNIERERRLRYYMELLQTRVA